VPGYEANSWFGVAGPAGLPKDIVDTLNKAFAAIVASPDTRKRLLDQGAEGGYMGAAEFRPYVAKEIAKWARVVKESNIKVK
jgi:tripartite-type tricarboxylate transporter receptor subunit TctC